MLIASYGLAIISTVIAFTIGAAAADLIANCLRARD